MAALALMHASLAFMDAAFHDWSSYLANNVLTGYRVGINLEAEDRVRSGDLCDCNLALRVI